MGRTTSFTLGDELEAFVRAQVENGSYASASEVIREALTRLADEDRKEKALLAALDAGIESRRSKPGTWERVSNKVRRTRTKRA